VSEAAALEDVVIDAPSELFTAGGNLTSPRDPCSTCKTIGPQCGVQGRDRSSTATSSKSLADGACLIGRCWCAVGEQAGVPSCGTVAVPALSCY